MFITALMSCIEPFRYNQINIENIKPEEVYKAVLEIGEIMTPRGPVKYTE
jgi:hypothetical protein